MAQPLPLKAQQAPNSPIKKGCKDILTGKYNFQLSKQAHLSDTAFYFIFMDTFARLYLNKKEIE